MSVVAWVEWMGGLARGAAYLRVPANPDAAWCPARSAPRQCDVSHASAHKRLAWHEELTQKAAAEVTVDDLKMRDFSPTLLEASLGASEACSQSQATAGSTEKEIYNLLQQIRDNPRAVALFQTESGLLRQ